MSITNSLNFSQLNAVNYLSGPCLVLAGAGSGKTRVITEKIAKLIESGIEPKQIAAITFTNKAAAEMRERARKIIGKVAAKVQICTFHSLGVKILRQSGSVIGLKEQFSILSSDDTLSLLKDIGNTTDLSTARLWQWQISQWKNSGLTAKQVQSQTNFDQQIALIYQLYQERLTAYQSVDFDDLLQLPLKLLQQYEQIRQYWQQQLSYLLVDEYQDTNALQYELVKLLAGSNANFTLVGDDDQSIYGWRGATLENLRQLPHDFTQLKVIKLEQNYRSTTNILQAANNVISNNPKLYPKKIWSQLGDGQAVIVRNADNEEHEAELAIRRIKNICSSQPTKWQDIAILYRANHQAKYFEQALRKANIPYKVSGGQSIFDKAEIKDLCAWFRLMLNPQDDLAFIRAITHPKRGVGHNSLQTLSNHAENYKLGLFSAVHSNIISSFLSPKPLNALKEFVFLIEHLQQQLSNINSTEQANTFFSNWLTEIGYEQHLYQTENNDKLASLKWSNVLDFCDWAANRLTPRSEDEPATATDLWDVLQTINLISSLNEQEQQQDQVTLSTLHAAKGLEWPHVILAGVNEDLLPFKTDSETNSKDLANRIQEERRLMYVGITRAQYSLQISWLSKRKKGREIVAALPSRFIAEMQLEQKLNTKQQSIEKLQQLRAKLIAKSSQQNHINKD